MIDELAIIGRPPEMRGFNGTPLEPIIAKTARIEAFVSVDAGCHSATYIGEHVWLMKHVHIGHDAIIGDHCELAPGVVVCGHAIIGRHVRIGVNACIKPYIVIGPGARIGMGAVVIDNIPPGEVWAGNPARMIHAAIRPPELEYQTMSADWEHYATLVNANLGAP